MNTAQHRIWCDEDEHELYEHFVDFNEWLDGETGENIQAELGIATLAQPSKALYASDKEAYDQVFLQFRDERRNEALNLAYFEEQFGDDHWFQRSQEHFLQLIDLMEKEEVVPFIGAGLSSSGGFPTWEQHLLEQGRTANLDPDDLRRLLDGGQFEEVIDLIDKERGSEVFVQEMRDVFSRTGTIPDVIWRLPELFSDTLITTNYDHLLEQAYDTGVQDSVQVINGCNSLEKPSANKTTIIKLHGDIRQPQQCILSKQQYNEAYGETIDISRQIPRLLSYYYKNSNLLFLGCSLHSDRTVDTIREIKSNLGEEQQSRQHFSIEQIPESAEALSARNAYLAQLGITPIWFQKGCYEFVENLLRLARSELSYRGHWAVDRSQTATEIATGLDTELDQFLRDFVDVMPVLHWLHKPIPQEATETYLSALQRIFHAASIFTEGLNSNLCSGLDYLLRPLSTKPEFDGYSHAKLSAAFNCFQSYFKEQGINEHLDGEADWNTFELLSVPLHQFEQILQTENKNVDHLACRLIYQLLRHGRHQQSLPKEFCKLPDTLNQEVTDFFAHVIPAQLGISIPDRLNEFANDEIRGLCAVAWENFDKPISPSLMDKLRRAWPF